MKQQFLNDLQKIYDFFEAQKNQTNKLFSYLENNELDKLTIIDDFAKTLEIAPTAQTRLALLNRLVNLREDSLVQVLNKLELSDEEIEIKKVMAYQFAKNYWQDLQKQRINFINENNLLTPFYRAIFEGVYNIGLRFSEWQPIWYKKIILENNKTLAKRFDDDDAKVIEFLSKNNLFDMGHNNEIADRCYSVLEAENNGYKSSPYIKAFKKEANAVIDAIEDLLDIIVELDDRIYNQKWEYVLYFQHLVNALSEVRADMLVSKWADVDRAWMDITTPIQVGHPLEYYEDHYRKAVALEWDIRLSNPKALNSQRVSFVKSAFDKIYSGFEKTQTNQNIYEYTLKSLNKVQLYIGQPALFFGAQFNGLFSAQVVPNDEVVSFELGKKIFAYSANILQTSRAKPFLKLAPEIFGREFVQKERKFLFANEKEWYEIYDISTIGHEYGHILWCDDTTESAMNASGNFKNIEEFKATTGGLMAYFLNDEQKELQEFVLIDLIKRSVGLIGWMEVDEVRPYYCEGLIHLAILFKTKTLVWENQKLTINLENFEALKEEYISVYTILADTYLKKLDALVFLSRYAKKDGKNFMPSDENIFDFVSHYYKRYKEIGQELDMDDKKSNYIIENQ